MSLSDAELRYLRKVDRESVHGSFYISRTDKGVIRSVHLTNLLTMGYLSWSNMRNHADISERGRQALANAVVKEKPLSKDPNIPAAELRFLRKAYKDSVDGSFHIKRFENGVIRSVLFMNLLHAGYVQWEGTNFAMVINKGLTALGKPLKPTKEEIEKLKELEKLEKRSLRLAEDDDDDDDDDDFGPSYRTKEQEEQRLDREFVPVAFETRRRV